MQVQIEETKSLSTSPSAGWKGYRELIAAMIRTGIFGYGGGPSIIPLIQHEAVIRYQWVSDEEFAEILALANTLPGPIATKMAAYLGYRVNGIAGAITSVLAHILPTTLAIILLLGLLLRLHGSKIVKDMISAVDPVIVVLLAMMTYDFAKKTYKGLGKWLGALFVIVAFLLLCVMKVPTAIVVVCFLLYGSVHLFITRLVKNILQRRSVKQGGENRD